MPSKILLPTKSLPLCTSLNHILMYLPAADAVRLTVLVSPRLARCSKQGLGPVWKLMFVRDIGDVDEIMKAVNRQIRWFDINVGNEFHRGMAYECFAFGNIVVDPPDVCEWLTILTGGRVDSELGYRSQERVDQMYDLRAQAIASTPRELYQHASAYLHTRLGTHLSKAETVAFAVRHNLPGLLWGDRLHTIVPLRHADSYNMSEPAASELPVYAMAAMLGHVSIMRRALRAGVDLRPPLPACRLEGKRLPALLMSWVIMNNQCVCGCLWVWCMCLVRDSIVLCLRLGISVGSGSHTHTHTHNRSRSFQSSRAAVPRARVRIQI